MKPISFPDFEEGQLREFLTHETRRQRERNRRAKVLSVMTVLLVTVYMSFVTISISRNLLNPSTAAQWIGYVAEENLPDIMTRTQRELNSQAPVIADRLMTGAILELPHYAAERARSQIDFVVDDQLPRVRTLLAESIAGHLATRLSEYGDRVASHKDPDFAKTFADRLVADMATDLDKELRREGDIGLADTMSVSLAALATLNQQLKLLNSGNEAEPTNDDERQRRLILDCIRLLEQHLGQADWSQRLVMKPGLRSPL